MATPRKPPAPPGTYYNATTSPPILKAAGKWDEFKKLRTQIEQDEKLTKWKASCKAWDAMKVQISLDAVTAPARSDAAKETIEKLRAKPRARFADQLAWVAEALAIENRGGKANESTAPDLATLGIFDGAKRNGDKFQDMLMKMAKAEGDSQDPTDDGGKLHILDAFLGTAPQRQMGAGSSAEADPPGGDAADTGGSESAA